MKMIRQGINCSDKPLQYKDINDKTKENLCIAWMKVILNDNTTWNNRFEYEKWINKQFGLNLFNEFKKLIGVNVVCKNDNSNNLPEKFLCSLNRLTNEVIIFEKGSDIDLVKFVLPDLEDATLVFNGLNPICDKLNDLYTENKLLKLALCEELQDNGNKYSIEIFDELFGLNYDEWESKNEYPDWEEILKNKKEYEE